MANTVVDKSLHTDGCLLSSSDEFENAITLRGSVECIIEEDDKVWVHHHKKNIIVRLGAKALAKLLAEGTAGYVIDRFQLGTKGHSGSDITSPVLPTINDTSLNDTQNVFEKRFVKPTDLLYLPADTQTQVQFTLAVEKNEGNPPTGSRAYTEAALICANGTMFARETFPAAIKYAGRRITFRWTILFD